MSITAGNPTAAEHEYGLLVEHLESSIRRERRNAMALMVISLIGGLGAIIWLWRLSVWGLDEIESASKGSKEGLYATTTFLLIRGIAYSGVVGAFLFGIFRLARAAMDQATRFDKRLIALHFIRFATGAERIDKDKLPLVVSVLSAWSATVDSAYTQPDDRKAPPSMKIRGKVGDKEIDLDLPGSQS